MCGGVMIQLNEVSVTNLYAFVMAFFTIKDCQGIIGIN